MNSIVRHNKLQVLLLIIVNTISTSYCTIIDAKAAADKVKLEVNNFVLPSTTLLQTQEAQDIAVKEANILAIKIKEDENSISGCEERKLLNGTILQMRKQYFWKLDEAIKSCVDKYKKQISEVVQRSSGFGVACLVQEGSVLEFRFRPTLYIILFSIDRPNLVEPPAGLKSGANTASARPEDTSHTLKKSDGSKSIHAPDANNLGPNVQSDLSAAEGQNQSKPQVELPINNERNIVLNHQSKQIQPPRVTPTPEVPAKVENTRKLPKVEITLGTVKYPSGASLQDKNNDKGPQQKVSEGNALSKGKSTSLPASPKSNSTIPSNSVARVPRPRTNALVKSDKEFMSGDNRKEDQKVSSKLDITVSKGKDADEEFKVALSSIVPEVQMTKMQKEQRQQVKKTMEAGKMLQDADLEGYDVTLAFDVFVKDGIFQPSFTKAKGSLELHNVSFGGKFVKVRNFEEIHNKTPLEACAAHIAQFLELKYQQSAIQETIAGKGSMSYGVEGVGMYYGADDPAAFCVLFLKRT